MEKAIALQILLLLIERPHRKLWGLFEWANGVNCKFVNTPAPYSLTNFSANKFPSLSVPQTR